MTFGLEKKEYSLKQIISDLTAQNNIRENLSNLRKEIKEESACEEAKELLSDKKELIEGFLESDDAKTRKNAALLIGDLKWDDSVDKLFDAYKNETTLFVKSAYLTAIANLKADKLLPDLRDKLEELQGMEVAEENMKHHQEELRALNKIIIKYEGITRHTAITSGQDMELLLVTNRNHREVVRRELENDLGIKTARVHPLGVMVQTDNLKKIFAVRSFRDMLFPIHTGGLLDSNPRKAAEQLWKSDLYKLLTDLHKEPAPFYYRIECRSGMDLDKRSGFSKKLASALDGLSGGMLINSASDYEVELRLIANREGRFFAAVKLYTIADHRFDYRKNAISASIHPSTAALLMEIARPYLKENAQIMDPFCGVGTMLIERDKKQAAREVYGTDIFGDAIEMARENTELAGRKYNYIHRDFFDFKHDYLFDEIVTNMPMRGKKTREEMESFYEEFFDKAKEILTDEGIIIMYTNEIGFVKKHLRLNQDYRLIQETCIQTKGDFYLLIMTLKR